MHGRTQKHPSVFLFPHRDSPRFSSLPLLLRSASSHGCLLISPDGLLSLYDVMESFRCVSRIARRFPIPSPSVLDPPRASTGSPSSSPLRVFCVGRLDTVAQKGRRDGRRGKGQEREGSFCIPGTLVRIWICIDWLVIASYFSVRHCSPVIYYTDGHCLNAVTKYSATLGNLFVEPHPRLLLTTPLGRAIYLARVDMLSKFIYLSFVCMEDRRFFKPKLQKIVMTEWSHAWDRLFSVGAPKWNSSLFSPLYVSRKRFRSFLGQNDEESSHERSIIVRGSIESLFPSERVISHAREWMNPMPIS